MQHMTIVTSTRPCRSRIAGCRTRSTFRTAHRELKVQISYVKTATGAVTLSYVNDAQIENRATCARHMVIAVAAHDALHAEHSRQAYEAEKLLAKLAEQAAQFPDQCDDADKLVRASSRDRNAARRELRKLEANLPTTPLRPRPLAAPYDAPYVRAW